MDLSKYWEIFGKFHVIWTKELVWMLGESLALFTHRYQDFFTSLFGLTLMSTWTIQRHLFNLSLNFWFLKIAPWRVWTLSLHTWINEIKLIFKTCLFCFLTFWLKFSWCWSTPEATESLSFATFCKQSHATFQINRELRPQRIFWGSPLLGPFYTILDSVFSDRT